MFHNYKKLDIYNMAFDLTKDIYLLTKEWPKEELYTLTTQIRKSAHSVNSNICEGVSRKGINDCVRFLYTSYASLQETENHLALAREMGYLQKERFDFFSERIDHLSRMIKKFISKLEQKSF